MVGNGEIDITSRSESMSFLQYLIWGSWLVALSSYVTNILDFTGTGIGMIYSPRGLAAIIISGIISIITDRWLRIERACMLCHLVCTSVLLYTTAVIDSQTMFRVMLVNTVAYIPTIALSNSVSYSRLAQSGQDPVIAFPPIRMSGTIGFIMAIWTVSLMGLELSSVQSYIASGASPPLTLYAFTLPKIPVTGKRADTTLANRLGLDAFVLFERLQTAVFFLPAMMLGAVLQITNVFGNPFLHDFARSPEFADSFVMKYPSILFPASQMAEVGSILTIPYFLKRFGVKTVMLMSMLAWTLRPGFFTFSDPSPFGFVLLLMSMIVYGYAFDFFSISGSVLVEQEISSSTYTSAQRLFMTVVSDIGAWVGPIPSGAAIDYSSVNGVRDWQTIWLVFAAYVLALAVIFALFFKYKHEPERLT